jgi:prepilin-type N-terminal cleavage/methylation domain-containing protein
MSIIKLKGFSLVEMSVVLVIIGVVFLGAFSGTGEQRKVAKQLKSEETLKNVKEQIMKFAMVNKYLPCPDNDVTPDGMQNRVAVPVAGIPDVNVCSSDIGTVPYLEIGIRRADAQDVYGNFIRYAVNRDAADQAIVVICDDDSSASYFCNATPGTAAFNLRKTPPLARDDGVGNYTVCNQSAGSCDASTTSASSVGVETKVAAVVLVAYNEDGAQTLSACGSASALNQQNCDTDAYYHQALKTSVTANFFDDSILAITGYEIKSTILSPVVVWNNTGANTPLTPTYNGYDLNADDYVPFDDASNPDVITVNRNITTALDLGQGNDYVVIGNDLASEIEYDNKTGAITSNGDQADLNTGEGDDSVYIVNAANSNVTLGDGDDQFVLGTDLTKDLLAEAGNDQVWIQGSVVEGTTKTSVTTTDPATFDTSYSRNAPSTGTTVSEPVTTTAGNVSTTKVKTTTVTSEPYSTWWWTGWKVITQVSTETTVVTSVPGMPTLNLGTGDDVLWLGDKSNASSGVLAGSIYGGDGDDKVWIQGGIDPGSTLTLGSGDDVLWLGDTENDLSGGLFSDIDGGSDYDILVLENMTQDQWNSDYGFQSHLVDFELVIFKPVNGTREYVVL